jgi:hypothetical protein
MWRAPSAPPPPAPAATSAPPASASGPVTPGSGGCVFWRSAVGCRRG